GRARYVDERTICLACPPDKNLEDFKMDNNYIVPELNAAQNISKADITVEYILSQIEGIRKDSEYLNSVIEKIGQYEDISLPENLPQNMMSPLGIVTRAEGLRDIVRCRETTSQKLIEFYGKVYDDIKPANASSLNGFIIEMIKATNAGAEMPDYVGIIQAMGKLMSEKK
ncbi:MAG: hypothetical protein PHW77_08295, partial [Eubacteriales bacterium]|nr:hypothetical protein [Eubacteriales bacterium]